MANPYQSLPRKAFWKQAVGERSPLDPGELYEPKFRIGKSMRIVTAGSCFAQHVGRALRSSGFNVLEAEPAPRGVSASVANRFGYGLYSARYGNIYTVRQLVQMLDEAEGRFAPANPVWEKDGRYYDAMRPNLEPEGLDSPDLVLKHRAVHLKNVELLFSSADLVVFTFGLTEAWIHRESRTVYPTAPGTICGRFDPETYSFKNYTFPEIYTDFCRFRQIMMEKNPDVKFLITTSPVPLTATAGGQHVEVATCYSKSVLRAVCGTLYEEFGNVDYFPSYEIITSANNRGVYFEANKRSVSASGVAAAMGMFTKHHDDGKMKAPVSTDADQDVVCEEALLEAFAK